MKYERPEVHALGEAVKAIQGGAKVEPMSDGQGTTVSAYEADE
ncbi:MAG: hypothetical protein WBD87_14155 [Candidatus Acidiferrales bacterium]